MKEKLLEMLAKREEQRKKLQASLIDSDKKEERSAINESLNNLDKEITELRSMIENCDKPVVERQENGNKFDPLAAMGFGKGKEERKDENPRSTMEYRTAFMNYVLKGERSNILELRQADQVESTDLGVLLPETVVQLLIKESEKVYGQLYSRVKKTNIKGGVKYPIGSFSATFKRITETTVSERQAAGGVTGSVQFTYKIGEVRIATTLLASVVSVPVFESELAQAIIDAYVKAMDEEILIGTEEANQCVGIITEAKKSGSSRIPTANIITFTEQQMKDWSAWKKNLFAKIPLSMRKERPTFFMTCNTFEANIETLQDSNGQPVARTITNPVNGDETARFFGREVVFLEPLTNGIEDFDSAAANAYFGIYMVPEKAYAINTNLQFSVKRYFDDETNQYVDKAIVINDGKVLDPKYIYLLKKVAK